MIKIKHEWETYYNGKITNHSEIIEMPELFWHGFRWDSRDGWYEPVIS